VNPRAVVLVEGVSDQRALTTLATRRGRDLDTEGVSVVPIGGAHSVATSSASAREASICSWQVSATSGRRAPSGARWSTPDWERI